MMATLKFVRNLHDFSVVQSECMKTAEKNSSTNMQKYNLY